MAEHQSLPDWLPAGWSVEVKVRNNGKKYKCYTDPSNELKFFSKPEVLRYLNSIEINQMISDEKNKGTRKRTAKKFVVEKAVAEGLPPGWIKEMRIRKNGRKIRRDPYYIDPTSGYVFRSKKDVVRFLETGELGRLASKPKDKACITVELADDKSSSPAESEDQKLADTGTFRLVTGNKGSKLGVAVEGQILKSNCTRDCVSLSEHTSDQSMEGTAMTCVNLPEADGLELRERTGNSSVSKLVSAPIVGALPENLPSENRVENHGNRKKRGRKKLNDRKGTDLPRRTSKRLAGIKVDSSLELKTKNRPRQGAARQSDQAEANTAEHPAHLAAPEEHPGQAGQENMDNEKQGCPIVLPQGTLSIPEACGGLETDSNGGEKPGSPLDLSLKDTWMDPCIEFAIKTLTGAIPIGDDSKTDRNTVSPQNLPRENPGSCVNMPVGDLWMDPCIEFAVKTLTGEIPVGDDLCIQDYLQGQQSSSETQGTNGLMSNNVAHNFCQTNFPVQHFDSTGKPLYTQQALMAPIPPHSSNICFQNSSNTSLHQQMKGSSEGCPRTTIR